MTDIFDPQTCDKYRKQFGEARGLSLIESSQNSLKKYAAELQQGFVDQNREQMVRAVHSLKSSATNLGAGQLRTMAEAMEEEYKNGADLSVQKPIDAINALVKKTLAEVQSYLNA